MDVLKLTMDFVRLQKRALGEDRVVQVIELNASESNRNVCHSHDFCDPNQVMLDAMAMQGADFDSQNNEQADKINRAFWLAKLAKFDVTTLPLHHVSIGTKRNDGDIQLLCAFNNDSWTIPDEDFSELVYRTVESFVAAGIDVQVFLRQDLSDLFSPEQALGVDETMVEQEQNIVLVNNKHIDRDVAFQLAQMGVPFSAIPQAQYDLAVEASKQTILVVWGVDDVLQQAENDDVEITNEKAEQVLAALKRSHDATVGINWDVISATIDNVLN